MALHVVGLKWIVLKPLLWLRPSTIILLVSLKSLNRLVLSTKWRVLLSLLTILILLWLKALLVRQVLLTLLVHVLLKWTSSDIGIAVYGVRHLFHPPNRTLPGLCATKCVDVYGDLVVGSSIGILQVEFFHRIGLIPKC